MLCQRLPYREMSLFLGGLRWSLGQLNGAQLPHLPGLDLACFWVVRGRSFFFDVTSRPHRNFLRNPHRAAHASPGAIPGMSARNICHGIPLGISPIAGGLAGGQQLSAQLGARATDGKYSIRQFPIGIHHAPGDELGKTAGHGQSNGGVRAHGGGEILGSIRRDLREQILQSAA